jgi:putative NADH-flavin reductase
MKTIALFGATGKTGSLFLNVALRDGYTVRALARNPEKLSTNHRALHVIEGDVLRAEDVEKTVEGADIVVSLFGHVKGSPEWLQTEGTKHITTAMKKYGVKRIISLSGGGLPFPEKDRPKLADKIIRGIMKMAVPKVLKDAVKHHEVLAKSGLDWTIVRGPRLTDEPRKGAYRTGWVGVNASSSIGRADLADCILTQVEDNQFTGQMPFVSY